ncbi:hypothetical protein ABZX30_23995 [Streptomyces sp. NPDC004542]|uniref:hypothetical protein n=1 Tax=Streptomyces sp. NPDC004542 TaxID=3154281 RepID=UPI0033B82D01
MKLGKALATGVAEEQPVVHDEEPDVPDEEPDVPEEIREPLASVPEEVPAAR